MVETNLWSHDLILIPIEPLVHHVSRSLIVATTHLILIVHLALGRHLHVVLPEVEKLVGEHLVSTELSLELRVVHEISLVVHDLGVNPLIASIHRSETCLALHLLRLEVLRSLAFDILSQIL